MDMYNRIRRTRSWRMVAHVRAVLTTGLPLLTERGAACRVHRASRPYRQGLLDDERPMEGPGAPGARFTPIETKAGRPRVVWSIHQDSPLGAPG